MMVKPEVETKLAAARTRLILDKPFLGALALRLPLVAADPKWCATSVTDARSLYYNPAYIANLSLEQTQFVLAREALHCALSHFARRQHRIKSRWDIACEYSINPVLVKDGLTPPPATIVIATYDGMTAEEIYPFIADDDSDDPEAENTQTGQDSNPDNRGSQEGKEQRKGGDGNKPQNNEPQSGGDSETEQQQDLQGISGAARPDPLTASELDALSTQWQQRMAGAALQAQQAGKLGGALARLVGEMLQPKLPWRMLLARYMTQVARDDYSYSRPSRREGDMIMPSLRSSQANIMVVLDTSGSVTNEELHEFLSEINSLKSQLRACVTLHACDTVLSKDGPWHFEAWEEFKLPHEFHGGGGTDFRPIFDWIKTQGKSPDILLYFTDAEGEFPKQEPHYPVLWLVKGKAAVPWGQRIQLN
jgi:predicted metal-dependent peptidase